MPRKNYASLPSGRRHEIDAEVLAGRVRRVNFVVPLRVQLAEDRSLAADHKPGASILCSPKRIFVRDGAWAADGR